MNIKRKLLLGFLIFFLTIISVFVAGVFNAETGGTSDYAKYPGNNFNFIVNQNNFVNGYYKPTGFASFWTVHSSPGNCGNAISGCVCNLPAFTDPSEVNISGWPFYNTYAHGACGSFNTYLPIAIIIDFLAFIIFYAVVFAIIRKLLRSSRIKRQRLNSSNK